MAKIKKIKQAVILAGGMGIRLRPYTYNTPKAIVPVNGKPFLLYLIEILKKNDIEEIVMLLGYLPEKTIECLGDGSKFGMKVRYSVGAINDGAGTRLRNARHLLDDHFLLMYCDNHVHLDLPKFINFHNKKNAVLTMTVYTNKYGVTKNNVFVDDEGRVVAYDKKRETPGLNGVDIGFFLTSKNVLDFAPEGDFYIYDLFPALIKEGKLAAFRTDGLYYSLSTPERMAATERFLKPRKVIFLDRDGVINRKMADGDYVKNWSEFEFLPGSIEALKLLSQNGYEIYIISNQAGVGRGLMSEGDLFEIHKNMEKELKKYKIKIGGIYYCPHRREENCLCRKPNPGMLFRAAIDHQIDLPNAYLIGDNKGDVTAGMSAGCKSILIKQGGFLQAVKKLIK